MKKISLILLAIALTVTSCKNYDDEFDDLNRSIAELQAQVAGFSSLQADLTALQSSVTSLQTSVDAIPTTQVDLSGLEADLATSLANIDSLQNDLDTVIANYATSDDLAATQAAIDQLNLALAAAQADLDELLAGNNVYDSNLSITNQAELDFAVGLGNKVMIINGTLTVGGATLTAAAVNVVTSKIVSVVGATAINLADGSVDLSALTSVGGAYTVTLNDAMDAALTSVGGAVTLNYDGGYDQPNLASAATLTVTDFVTAGTDVGTLMVDFSGLTVTTPVAVATTFASATSVKVKNAYSNIVANSALTVDMLAANYKAGLTVEATEAGSVITIAGRVDDGLASPTGKALSVTGSATSVLNAAAVTKTTTLDVVDIETALSFPALTDATAVTADAAVSFDAPLLVAATVNAAAAKTVSLVSTATLNAVAVEDLTFSALASPYTAASTLKTADITGKVGGAGAFTSTTGTLISATFAGELDAVSITGTGSATTDKLTSVTTTGAIDSFTLDNSAVITSVSLGHSHIAGGLGSTVEITSNAKLASLTTSTNYLRTLTVTGNAELATVNFASYTDVVLTGTATITINGNALEGTFTGPVAATGTTAFIEATITQGGLATLSTYVFDIDDAGLTLVLDVDIDDVNAADPAETLATVLTADLQGANNASYTQSPTIGTAMTVLIADADAVLPADDNDAAASFTMLDTAAEFALIQ